MEEKNPGLDCLVIGDKLKSHTIPKVVENALSHNVHMWFLPSNTSHFLQP